MAALSLSLFPTKIARDCKAVIGWYGSRGQRMVRPFCPRAATLVLEVLPNS